MSINIRKAGSTDKDFIIKAIMESEKSGSDIVSYCAIFSIDEDTFRGVLSSILDEGMEGQELCISNFLVAEVDGERAAAVSTWVEKAEGIASNMIKSNLFMYFMDREVLLNAAAALALVNEINISRDEHALQVENVYTEEKFRGMGLAGKLIDEHIRLQQQAGAKFDKVQVILLKNNAKAIRSYEKAGFTIKTEKQCGDKAIYNLFPCDTKILMERQLTA
jgi:ribosomal protein S18 acetylase RimI-like enzyme